MNRLPLIAAAVATAVAGSALIVGPTANADAATTALPARATTLQTRTTARQAEAEAEAEATPSPWVRLADVIAWPGRGEPPAGQWYFSTLNGYTTPTAGPGGLTFPGKGVLLHSTTGDATTGLADIASSTGTTPGTADLVAEGASFTVVVDLDGDGAIRDQNQAALVADVPGEAGIDGTYTSFTTVGDIPAGTPATLSRFQAQLVAADPHATLHDYGVSTATGPATVSGIAYRGTDTYFTPEPTPGSVTPSPLTQHALATSGVRIDQPDGFLPGETVTVAVIAGDGTTAATAATGTSLVAAADGSVSGPLTLGGVAPGSYSVSLVGSTTGIVVTLPFVVVADPATPNPSPSPEPPTTAPTTPTAPVATAVSATATFTG